MLTKSASSDFFFFFFFNTSTRTNQKGRSVSTHPLLRVEPGTRSPPQFWMEVWLRRAQNSLRTHRACKKNQFLTWLPKHVKEVAFLERKRMEEWPHD